MMRTFMAAALLLMLVGRLAASVIYAVNGGAMTFKAHVLDTLLMVCLIVLAGQFVGEC